MNGEWLYKHEPVTDDLVAGYYGFVYAITNTLNGKKYLGRKYFTKAASKQVKGKRKKIRKESDWKEYWGSSEKLLKDVEALGKESFTREILRLCKTRGECNYWEAKMQFGADVLTTMAPDGSPAYYNDNIMMKFTRHNIG